MMKLRLGAEMEVQVVVEKDVEKKELKLKEIHFILAYQKMSKFRLD
jgi:hypothetical protein